VRRTPRMFGGVSGTRVAGDLRGFGMRRCAATLAVLTVTLASCVSVAAASTHVRSCGTWGANPFAVYATTNVSCQTAKHVTQDSFFHGCIRNGSCTADSYLCKTRRQASGDFKTTCTRANREVIWYGGA
jgi:hypothetical protein